MKRLTFSLACLAFLASLSPALRAEPPSTGKPEHSKKADARYTKELLTLLQETHSVDAFVVSLDLLLDMDCDARTVIPIVIRNAERLGIYGDTLLRDEEGQDDNRAIAIVSEAIKMLQDRVRPNRDGGKEPKSEQKAKSSETPAVKSEINLDGSPNGLSRNTGWQMFNPCPFFVPPQQHWEAPKSSIEVPDGGTVIMGGLPPMRAGYDPTLDAPPTDDEVLMVLPRLVWERFLAACCNDRQSIHVFKERIAEDVEPARLYPGIGVAQLHRCHWKCTVCYGKIRFKMHSFFTHGFDEEEEIAESLDSKFEVVYMDKDYLAVAPRMLWCRPAVDRSIITPFNEDVFPFWTGFKR